ncbi:MAG TPA: carboxylating nicotinate-nucleotide diphosphorylase [Desulfotomaculum sp.]|nr:MAG: Nicotinate-nucleotide pyrophosphorylase [Desulfotomaculum sp. 46_80]KUK85388.1 MAG: Nicotinate-nucleotide pyrophosphorylase [Desulfofundulus kuznetsovii]HAG10647.1 carboxylating nicotinate-nucleotide diphosphorylase [Desulfotomaculum sp.]HBY03391.1 carboxylating nicotinate-nucleotide diphosphorylase [Desulfotomaculum sp.]
MSFDSIALRKIIERALEEDIGNGDITTDSIVGIDEEVCALIHAGEPGVIAGLPVAGAVFNMLDPDIDFSHHFSDGQRVEQGQLLASVRGNGRCILKGERVALNLMQRLSGIATQTSRLVSLIAQYKARIIDTRKTTPGLRILEKYAVRTGGGFNHRFGLYDAVLIKDNHLKAAGSISRAVELVKASAPFAMKIEVEVEDLAGVAEALSAGVDIIMLDNMSVSEMSQAVELAAGKVLLEASGGITEQTVVSVAQTGVDLISVGYLTHSARALDIGLELI